MDKRAPILADRLLANNNSLTVHPNTFRQIRDKMRNAHRFVLDKPGSIRYGEVIRDIPELILREQMFARAPYDVTWIEFQFREFWETVNGRSADLTSDRELGFLIDHDTAYIISEHAQMMPFAYDLHQPWEPGAEQRFVDLAGTAARTSFGQGNGLDQFFWGSIYDKLASDERQTLRAHHSVRALPLHDKLKWHQRKVITHLVGESYADLRNIIGLLLLLNRPSVTSYIRDVPRARGFIKGKMLPYMAHTVVTIHVDPTPILRLIGTTADAAVEKRHHEVRGTWCHDETYRKGVAQGCVHDWIPHPNHAEGKVHVTPEGIVERDNWLCQLCHGHRWHRDQHSRGNSLVGVVGKNYNVTV
jgi:hypothetical protein